jgi:hypothetical protein
MAKKKLEYKTLADLKEDIDNLLKAHPEYKDFPIAYAVDEEGNAYHKVYNSITGMQVHDLNEHELEVVGFEGAEDIDTKDINCICIN